MAFVGTQSTIMIASTTSVAVAKNGLPKTSPNRKSRSVLRGRDGSTARLPSTASPKTTRIRRSGSAIAVPALAAADPLVPTLHIPRVSQPPALHAFVGEKAPGEFARVCGFRQREPDDGEPTAMPTSAYVGYDGDNLYVVFVCIDDPARVRVSALTSRR